MKTLTVNLSMIQLLRSKINSTKQWLKHSKQPSVVRFVSFVKAFTNFELPLPLFLLRVLYMAYCFILTTYLLLTRIFLWTPLFKGRLKNSGKYLNLYGGIPYISGPVEIEIGESCRISGQSTFSGRTAASVTPTLIIGDNVDIGWMTTIAVGSTVVLGNNVRIAGRTILAGYPGHPIDPKSRAMGLPETDEQVGDIILEQDVWLATGVSVMAGVRIGRGAIIAAGSVVTHDIPPMVLAGGIPAKVIRSLDASTEENSEA